MRYFIPILSALLLFGCSPKIDDSYKGYIFAGDKPLTGVEVTECETSNNTAYTDQNGYFILQRKRNGRVRDIVVDQGDRKDTILVMRGGSAGRAIHYLLLDANRIDTVDLERERSY